MRQLVYTMFISNNHPSFHLWWEENLVKHWKVSKDYETNCGSSHEHQCSKYKNCLNVMILIYIKEHRSNIWSSIHKKVKQRWCWVGKKALLIKKICNLFLSGVIKFSFHYIYILSFICYPIYFNSIIFILIYSKSKYLQEQSKGKSINLNLSGKIGKALTK